MADVFLSYNREDRARVGNIVDAITAAGFSVWWDERITPQGEWDETIMREIESAKAVVVLWTDHSVKSKWVRTEAHYANERQKLIPVRIDDCDLPIAFLLNQTADLAQWKGDQDDNKWRKLLEWIEELARGVPLSGSEDSGAKESNLTSSRWRRTYGTTASGEVVFDGATISRRTAGGTFFKDAEDFPLMCVLPAGSYAMGSSSEDGDQRDSETPRHVVDFKRPFAIGVYLITFDDWDALYQKDVLTHAPSDGGWGRGSRPVSDIAWTDAQAFVAGLSELGGVPYRLPTESEWEYACRAGSTGQFSVGQSMDTKLANYNGGSGADSIGRTTEVGAYPANSFGLHDTHGNVREWVQDLWHDDYASAPADGLAWTSGHGGMRVLRGGSWLDAAWFLRSAARGRGGESDRTNFIGFRVARDIV